jgi:hypothetical protein
LFLPESRLRRASLVLVVAAAYLRTHQVQF